MSRRELFRRGVHLGVGGGAFLLPHIGWQPMAVLCAAAVLFNLLLLPWVPVARNLLREGGPRGHAGLVLYPLAVGILVLLFRENHIPIQAGWLALAVGDGLAPSLAAVLPHPRWPGNPRKSLGASLLAFSLAAAAMLPAMSAQEALVAAAGGLVAEGLPLPWDDNLTVPLAAALGASLAGGAWA